MAERRDRIRWTNDGGEEFGSADLQGFEGVEEDLDVVALAGLAALIQEVALAEAELLLDPTHRSFAGKLKAPPELFSYRSDGMLDGHDL